jgi:dipeptidyl aminopeptidase/acylaminoacyl peptidase
LIGVLLGLRIGIAVLDELADMRPDRAAVPRNPPLLGQVALESVAFETRDGVRVSGWYAPSQNGAAVILGHGYGGNRQQLLPEAGVLSAQGYGVLLFDYRAHGESGGDVSTFGDLERNDVRAALDFASSRPGVDPGRLGLFGFSMGALPIAIVAAEDRRVRAVALGGVTSSMLDACVDEAGRYGWLLGGPVALTLKASGVRLGEVRADDAAARLAGRSLLVIQGEHEDFRLAARARQVYAAAKSPKQYLVVPNAGHRDYIEADPNNYPAALVSFFRAAL